MTLDAGSRFSYPQPFQGDTRRVSLNGEGYFEVSPNKKKPFIVHANFAEIKVIGTKFNVRAWAHTEKVNVAVAEGNISFRLEKASPGSGVFVKKGQLSILPKNGRPSIPRPVNIGDHLGWLNRNMVFTNIPLREILAQVERWYDVRFIPGENIPLSDHLNMHIEDKPLDDVLELVSVLAELKYKRSGRDIYLYRINPK
ncbi:MAG: FecR family protein [bacterium]|nr:FecR family protein [bacterium]